MATLSQTQAADFVKIHEAMDSPMLTWEGDEYRCIPTGKASMKKLAVGGMDSHADFIGKVLKSDFSSGSGPFPAALDLITYSGTVYEIDKATSNESDVFIVLVCIENT